MGKSTQQNKGKQGTASVTFAEHVSQVKRTHRAVQSSRDTTGRRMVDAGLALIGALDSGAVTFDRVTGKEATALRATGALTKSDLATALGTSGTMLTKYRNVGLIVRAGVTPDTHKSDWTFLTEAAASAWVTEAAATGDAATITKAIADHRPGATKGDQTNGQTKGKAKGTKSAQPAAAKPAAPKVTKESVTQDARRILAWLSAPTRLAALSTEDVDTLRTYLTDAAEIVEAESHKRAAKGQTPDVATALAKVS